MRCFSALSATAICVASIVILPGCTDTGADDLNLGTSVSVNPAADAAMLAQVRLTGQAGQKPSIEFSHPISVTGPVARLVDQGTGTAIEEFNAIVAQIVVVDGENGQEKSSTYGASPQIMMVDETNMPRELRDVLINSQVGVRILYAGPTEMGTAVSAIEITSILDLLVAAEGTQVAPAAGLPLIDYADSPSAEGKMPLMAPVAGPPPDKLVIQPLIVGNGAVITSESKLVVQVAGWLWNGTSFNNSWEIGNGLPVILSETIEGWREGLPGQTIGSQVMLVVPPEMAWDGQGKSNIPAGSTLVYVIDILAGI